MAREYPRFLYSNPQNTKSKGPFVVHLLKPRLICRYGNKFSTNNELEILEVFDDAKPAEVDKVIKLMQTWVDKENFDRGYNFSLKWDIEDKKNYPDALPETPQP